MRAVTVSRGDCVMGFVWLGIAFWNHRYDSVGSGCKGTWSRHIYIVDFIVHTVPE